MRALGFETKEVLSIIELLVIVKISGDFPVKCRIELVLGEISGDFPVKQSKMTDFHVFLVNKRNFSVYLSYL